MAAWAVEDAAAGRQLQHLLNEIDLGAGAFRRQVTVLAQVAGPEEAGGFRVPGRLGAAPACHDKTSPASTGDV